jgi:hypothetical protein
MRGVEEDTQDEPCGNIQDNSWKNM